MSLGVGDLFVRVLHRSNMIWPKKIPVPVSGTPPSIPRPEPIPPRDPEPEPGSDPDVVPSIDPDPKPDAFPPGGPEPEPMPV